MLNREEYIAILELANDEFRMDNKILFKQLEEKNKIIEEVINYIKKTKVFENETEIEIKLSNYWFIKEILKILERGKNRRDNV